MIQSPLKRAATVLIATISIAVAVYSLWLLVIGQKWTSVDEGSAVGEIVYIPTPAAVFPLISAIAILAGLYFRRPIIYWLGFVMLAIFATLFLFGIGGPLIPVYVVLFALLLILQFSKNPYSG